MNETAQFFNSIVGGLNSLTVVGLIALIVILVFLCLKFGWIKPEWFFIKNKRDKKLDENNEKLDQILTLVNKFDTNDLRHTCQSADMDRLNTSMKAINESMEKIMISMERTSELLRQITYNQKDICDKYDNHDMQARDIKNLCTNIWEKKCKSY